MKLKRIGITHLSLKGRSNRGLAAVLGCSVLLSALLLCACDSGNLEAAQAAFDRGVAAYNALDMDSAKQAFAESCGLDGSLYEDAKQYLDAIGEYEKLYLSGVAAFEKGDYTSAASAFLGIKGYLNSEEYLASMDAVKARYENAAALYDAGDYLAAREAFMQLGDYQRSETYVANVDAMIGLYNEGVALMNRSSYINAARAFRAINTSFLDSEELIASCENRLNDETVKLGEYISNYNKEYDGKERIEGGDANILFYMKDTQGVWISGAMDESGVIRYMSFHIPEDTAAKLGTSAAKSALAHCIRALNPELASYADILAEFDGFDTQTGRQYGCMRVHRGENSHGGIVLTADYEPQG